MLSFLAMVLAMAVFVVDGWFRPVPAGGRPYLQSVGLALLALSFVLGSPVLHL